MSETSTPVSTETQASPKPVRTVARQKVPAFARYKGTSAWRKYPNRVREYARFRAASQ